MNKSANHDCSTWVFDTHAKKLKRKSMLLVKKLRIANAPKTPFVHEQYYLAGVQMDRFKHIHL